jgi:hypothetical protein
VIRFTVAPTVAVLAAIGLRAAALPVESLVPVRSLPQAIAVQFDRTRACAEMSTGDLLVLDVGAHTLFLVNANRPAVRRLLAPGPEWGHVLKPTALALGAGDVFAVADAPGQYDRIQSFSPSGAPLGRFFPPSVFAASSIRLSIGPLTLNGVGTMQFTGKTFLLTAPSTGALMMEVQADGNPLRSIGALRPTGQEADRRLHLVLNAGLPLIDPSGGFYFVFQAGLPMFRKYDAAGTLMFERHIEGAELDGTLRAMPTSWPARSEADPATPYAPPSVSAAAVDQQGRLWVSLTVPFTYVYDPTGDKVRVVQFKDEHGAVIAPASLAFTGSNRVILAPGCAEYSSK